MGPLAALALLRVHVLVVELPGRPLLRLRAEAAVRARGWVVTADPADADLLLVCGTPLPDLLDAVGALWARVPAPRARRTVAAEADLEGALDSAARVIGDARLQREAAAAGPVVPPPLGTRLGPLLPGWPAGLVLDCAVDRDGRVTAVGVRRTPAEQEEDPAGLRNSVLPVAAAARLLRLAGLPDAALRLDRVVDLALTGTGEGSARRRLRRSAAALRGSWLLQRVLREAGDGVDVRARVLALLDAALEGSPPPAPPPRRLVGRRMHALPLLVAATEPVDG